jgi:hypothetical protein
MDNLIAQHSASLAPHQLPTGPLILGAFYASLRYSSHTALKLLQNQDKSMSKDVTLKAQPREDPKLNTGDFCLIFFNSNFLFFSSSPPLDSAPSLVQE